MMTGLDRLAREYVDRWERELRKKALEGFGERCTYCGAWVTAATPEHELHVAIANDGKCRAFVVRCCSSSRAAVEAALGYVGELASNEHEGTQA